MRRAAFLALLPVAQSIERRAGSCLVHGEQTFDWGPMKVNWSEVATPMTVWEDYSEFCDPRSAEFKLNNTALLKDIGINEHVGSSWIAMGLIAQVGVIMAASYLLPPDFTISKIAAWRCIKSSTRPGINGLYETISKKLVEVKQLTEKDEDWHDPVVEIEDRVDALQKLDGMLLDVESDHILGWNKSKGDSSSEKTFERVQDQISKSKLQPNQKEFLLRTVMACFYDPKDRLQIFGTSLADLHPQSPYFEEEMAFRYIGERLKQPAEKASVPMPWSQRVQMGLFVATFFTLVSL